jgi:hypothetical protein
MALGVRFPSSPHQQNQTIMNTPLFKVLKWFNENQLDLRIPQECIEIVECYIKDEKETIIKAREHGIYTMINGSPQDKQMTSEDYYNKIKNDDTEI